MLTHPSYKICFVLDKSSMFHVESTLRDGTEKRHQVKPLKIIWDKFSQWNENNTLHIDDMAKNFALNPGCGVCVSGYYRKKSKAKKAGKEQGKPQIAMTRSEEKATKEEKKAELSPAKGS